MSDVDPPRKTPSEELSEILAKSLVDKKLVLAKDANKLAVDLAAGEMRAEDWRVIIEKALDKGA